MKIKPEIRDRWVTALRSGEFSQGQGQLRSTEADGTFHHCCLGVLTELASRDGALERSMDDYAGCGFLPGQVITWAEMDSDDPMVPGEYEQQSLSSLNDDGTSFAEIADMIEANS